MSALWPVQQALVTKLRASSALMAKARAVVDDVSDGQEYPYVVVGDGTEIPFDTMDRAGKEVAATIHIWSQYAGFKEALEILGIINALLDRRDLAVTGYGTVGMQFSNSQTLRDPDGVTRHVVARYRIIVQSNT